MPNGYTFYRILRADEGGSLAESRTQLGDISGSVMMASPLSGTGTWLRLRPWNTKACLWFSRWRLRGGYQFQPDPSGREDRCARLPSRGNYLSADGRIIVAGHIGTGASNAHGQYVTTIEPAERRTPSRSLTRREYIYSGRAAMASAHGPGSSDLAIRYRTNRVYTAAILVTWPWTTTKTCCLQPPRHNRQATTSPVLPVRKL